MRKNINKLVAIAIGISVISGSLITPAFADSGVSTTSTGNVQTTSNQKKLLTVSDAINATIANSGKLSLKSEEIKKYKNQLDVQRETNDFNDKLDSQSDFQETKGDFQYDKLDLQRDQGQQVKNYIQDQISNDITSKYNAIVSKEIEINNLKDQIDVKKKDISNMELKNNLGLSTQLDLSSKKLELQELNNSENTEEENLQVAKDYLGVLTGLDINDYEFDRNVKYTTFKINGDIDNYIDGKLDEYYKYDDKLLDLTKDYVDDYEDEALDGETKLDDYLDKIKLTPEELIKPSLDNMDTYKDANGDFDPNKYLKASLNLQSYQQNLTKYITALSAYSDYWDTKYGYESRENQIDEAKKSLKNSLKSSYVKLNDLEKQIEATKQKADITNKQLEQAKLKYDLGLITYNEYKTQALDSTKVDTQLRNLIVSYNNIKDSIEKPWINLV